MLRGLDGSSTSIIILLELLLLVLLLVLLLGRLGDDNVPLLLLLLLVPHATKRSMRPPESCRRSGTCRPPAVVAVAMGLPGLKFMGKVPVEELLANAAWDAGAGGTTRDPMALINEFLGISLGDV